MLEDVTNGNGIVEADGIGITSKSTIRSKKAGRNDV